MTDLKPDVVRIPLSTIRALPAAPRFLPGDRVAVLLKGKRGETVRAVGTIELATIAYSFGPVDPTMVIMETTYQVKYRIRNKGFWLLVAVSGNNITPLPEGDPS